MKEKENYKIIIPTLYIGGIEPEEPKEYDVWYYDIAENHKMLVYSGKKWCECFFYNKTGYSTIQQETNIKFEEKEKSKEQKEIQEYRQLIKDFKSILEKIKEM